MYLKTLFPQLKKKSLADLFTIGFLAAVIYLFFHVGHNWEQARLPLMQIDLGVAQLPMYASFSLVRALIALFLSLIFSMFYGTAAASSPKAEKWMIPVLDILQSVPVLGFLPGLAIVMMTFFPESRVGLEIVAILMIFTSQAWNMTFSIYQSVKQTPPVLKDVAQVYHLKFLRNFLWVELPYGMIPLVWNAMMSVAGGWFFLMICESFVLKGKDFRLPGLGAYMSAAINKGDTKAIVAGALTMLALILLLEVFLWKPLMSWAIRFKWEGAEQPRQTRGIFLYRVFKRSPIVDKFMERFLLLIDRLLAFNPPSFLKEGPKKGGSLGRKAAVFFPLLILASLSLFGLIFLASLLISIPAARWGTIFENAGLTALRVFLSLFLASLWTIPVGILIGYFPKVTRVAQPLVQIAAAFPMPMLFPLVLLGLHWFGIGMGVGSIVLLTLALQWYLLFNTIAGASFVPQGFKDVAQIYRLKPWLMTKKIILPALFPFLVTGWITGAGGAWNATIVAEYVYYKGDIFMTKGLGSLMSQSAAHGEYAVLAASLVVMVLFVVGFNRVFWKRLSRLAQTRYALGE